MKPQATRIEPSAPGNGVAELVGCIGAGLLFSAGIAAVYACPFVIAWMTGH